MTRDRIITARLSDDEYETLKNVTEREGATVSDLIRQNIREMAVQSEVSDWE